MSRVLSFEMQLEYDCGTLSEQLRDDMSAMAFDPELDLYIVTIKNEYWAPGIWAGTEGLPVVWEWSDTPTERFKVAKVDFKNRQVHLKAYTPIA